MGTSTTNVRLSPAILAILLVASIPAAAQVIPGIPVAGSVEGYFQSFDIEEGTSTKTISQLVTPIGFFIPVTDRFDIRLATSYAALSRSSEGEPSENVSGLTDIKVQATYALVNRRLLVGLVTNIPAGSGQLTSVEQDLVFDFIAPDLSVRANRLGEGFNAGGTLVYAAPVSQSVSLSVSAAAVARGAYDTSLPNAESTIRLDPGLMANASLGADVFTGMSHIRIAATYSYYGTERIDGIDAYRIGSEVSISGNYGLHYSSSRGRFSLGLHQITRLDNSISLNGVFGTEVRSTNGSYFAGSLSNEYAVSSLVLIDVSALARFIGKNEFEIGDGTVMEGGFAVTFTPSPKVALSLGGRYISGSGTGRSGLDRSITGIEATFRTVVRLTR